MSIRNENDFHNLDDEKRSQLLEILIAKMNRAWHDSYATIRKKIPNIHLYCCNEGSRNGTSIGHVQQPIMPYLKSQQEHENSNHDNFQFKYSASIKLFGINIDLGVFPSAREACEVYDKCAVCCQILARMAYRYQDAVLMKITEEYSETQDNTSPTSRRKVDKVISSPMYNLIAESMRLTLNFPPKWDTIGRFPSILNKYYQEFHKNVDDIFSSHQSSIALGSVTLNLMETIMSIDASDENTSLSISTDFCDESLFKRFVGESDVCKLIELREQMIVDGAYDLLEEIKKIYRLIKLEKLNVKLLREGKQQTEDRLLSMFHMLSSTTLPSPWEFPWIDENQLEYGIVLESKAFHCSINS